MLRVLKLSDDMMCHSINDRAEAGIGVRDCEASNQGRVPHRLDSTRLDSRTFSHGMGLKLGKCRVNQHSEYRFSLKSFFPWFLSPGLCAS
jgi:hypothetical protein